MNSPVLAESALKALSDTTRLRIISLLSEAGELCVCDLQAILQLSQPKISRHLKVLRDETLVVSRRAGTWVHYSINASLPAWTLSLIDSARAGAADGDVYRQDRDSLARLKTGEACR